MHKLTRKKSVHLWRLKMNLTKINIATFIAILFHFCGVIGILFTPYKDWFIQNTPFNLCLMAVLLVWTHPQKNISFFIFLVLVFVTGMIAEITGVHTAYLFGSYQYGNILGPEISSVPWLIGVNWCVLIFCSAAVMQKVHVWFEAKMSATEGGMPKGITTLSWIVDGALLAVFFDWLMEPVAVKLGFWQWKDGIVPVYNYVCWFVISAALLFLMRRFPFNKANHFAVHLFIIQALFFLALRTLL